MGHTIEKKWKLRNEGHAERFFVVACQLREQHHLVDVTVTLGPKNYRAHSALLAAASSVFRQRLQCREQGVMELDGVTTPQGWEAILNFAYTGELEIMPEIAEEVLDAAEALGIPRVAEICKAVLIGTETEDRLSPAEEMWETLQGLQELYEEGIGWDLALNAEGDTYQGDQGRKKIQNRDKAGFGCGIKEVVWGWAGKVFGLGLRDPDRDMAVGSSDLVFPSSSSPPGLGLWL